MYFKLTWMYRYSIANTELSVWTHFKLTWMYRYPIADIELFCMDAFQINLDVQISDSEYRIVGMDVF